MIRYNELIGLKALNRENGEKIGEIIDIVFSENLNKIVGLVIEDGMLFKDRKMATFENIDCIGKDAIMLISVEDYESKRGKKEYDKYLGKNIALIDKEVLDESGEFIGYVKDFIINSENGEITGYIITEGIIEDIVKGRRFIPSGRNMDINKENIIISHEIKDMDVKNEDIYKKLLELW